MSFGEIITGVFMNIEQINKIYTKSVEKHTKQYNDDIMPPHILIGDYGIVASVTGLYDVEPNVFLEKDEGKLINPTKVGFKYEVGILPVRAYNLLFPASYITSLTAKQLGHFLEHFIEDCIKKFTCHQSSVGNFGIRFSPFAEYMFDESVGDNTPYLRTIVSTNTIDLEGIKELSHEEFVQFKKSLGI